MFLSYTLTPPHLCQIRDYQTHPRALINTHLHTQPASHSHLPSLLLSSACLLFPSFFLHFLLSPLQTDLTVCLSFHPVHMSSNPPPPLLLTAFFSPPYWVLFQAWVSGWHVWQAVKCQPEGFSQLEQDHLQCEGCAGTAVGLRGS